MAVNKVDLVLKKMLKQIEPSAKEQKEVQRTISGVLSKLQKSLERIHAKAVPGGSIAKQTWISEQHDLDIFVKFDYEHWTGKQLSDALENACRKSFKQIERVHGSRDYFHIRHGKYEIETVPVLDISKPEQAENVTDLSPFHTEWVSKKTLQRPKLSSEVRLLKQFCRSAGVYGAESFIMGFSGYVLEILTIHYGNFAELARSAAGWKSRAFIDADKKYANESQAKQRINPSRLVSPMLVVDPVQPERNAAAALSEKNFEIFKQKCKDFMKRPSEDYFRIRKMGLKELKKDAGKNYLVTYEAVPVEDKRDIAGCKIVKSHENIVRIFKQNGFEVVSSGWQWNDKAIMWYNINKKKIDEYYVREGPDATSVPNAEDFRKVHKNTFIKNGRLYAKIKRKYVNASELAKDIAKIESKNGNVKRIRIVTA